MTKLLRITRIDLVPSALADAIWLLMGMLSLSGIALAQTPPVTGMAQVNGIRDVRMGQATLIHCKLWKSADEYIADASLVISEGKVVYAGPFRKSDSTAASMNLAGKVVYPAFVEMVSDYGMPALMPPTPAIRPPQYERQNGEGKYWNEHIKPEFDAYSAFKPDSKLAADWRKLGFGYLMTHQRDGIMRGTGALVSLTERDGKEPIVLGRAANCMSFSRSRVSLQQYPGSLMGSIALIRQAIYDSRAYTGQPYNASLEAIQANEKLPIYFEAGQMLNLFRAGKIGSEFGMKFIMRGSGSEYQRADDLKKLGSPLIVPINYPKAFEIQDPLESDLISLEDLMHWEMAPANLARLDKAGVPFTITTDLLKDRNEFWPNLRRAVKAGLSEMAALRAMTELPAKLLNIGARLGSLKPGMDASFTIADQSLFTAEGKVMETWVEGQRFIVQDAFATVTRGKFKLTLGRDSAYTLNITEKETVLLHAPDTNKIRVEVSQQAGWVVLTGKFPTDTNGITRLTGWLNENGSYRGDYRLPSGIGGGWIARPLAPVGVPKQDTVKPQPVPSSDLATRPLQYPYLAFGLTKAPAQETILYRNATVWTNEAEGKIEGADVLISGGKIVRVGKGLTAPAGTRTVDATGRHITPGIIDEHSHIAINGGVNECTHAITAECRIGDVVNSEDPNIYRHLAGGVVAVQQLHGSCNPIGGQSSLIKLRWGALPEDMKIAGADGFIKCALGENVKQSNFGDVNNVRYPQTRMGVEQVFLDAFTRAKTYKADQARYAAKGKNQAGPAFRRDLQLEAVNEILDKKRFITCHSYVQSEIEMLMRVADSMGFRVNTFTHILEGYKIAPRMAQHGAGGSTFADWWYYKMEVNDAIPYNAALMHRAGVVVAINSDDAEMGRRLNQEAAKVVRYGGVSEEDAMKMVTLNPAKLLHLDGHMGSLKPGKYADIVVWTKHPFAPGAKPIQTLIDGKVYFDLATDSTMRQTVIREKERIIQVILKEKAKGPQMPAPPMPPKRRQWHCEDADGRDESWQ